MADDKLSAREAALIEQARAELARKRAAAPQAAPAAAVARVKRTLPAAEIEAGAPQALAHAAPGGDKPVAPGGADPVERIAAVMAAARAETARTRQRQRKIYVWVPVAFFATAGMWTLLWMWQRL